MAIATIKGVWVRPGVSKNNRWYKPEHIAAAVEEAQSAISSGNAPIVAMLTHHGARDPRGGDVTRTAGRITKVGLDGEGNGTFEAELADTQAGRDVAALVTPEKPFLKGVSMASLWKGTPRSVQGPNGDLVETADGFSLKGLDLTHNPGVTGAEIKASEAVVEASVAGTLFESLEEVTFEESVDEADKAPYGDVTYADPGYQADKKKRYPLDTAAHVRAAWSYINMPKNAKAYSVPQVKRIKGKIKSAAKKFNVNIAEELRLLAGEVCRGVRLRLLRRHRSHPSGCTRRSCCLCRH